MVITVEFSTALTTGEVDTVIACLTQAIVLTILVFADQGGALVAGDLVIISVLGFTIVHQVPDRDIS